MQHTNTISDIRRFLCDLIETERPDLIVCAERKATAIMRCLIDEGDPTLSWDWKRVLSTAAIKQFDWEEFKGSRVLLFDELVHHGKTLEKHTLRLQEALPEGVSLRTASFAVWDRCEHRPDVAYHGAVDLETYEGIRDNIVQMLQEHGSLLLDTEHLEVSVKLQCGVRDFYDALARGAQDGHTWSFVSGAGRTNLTIEQPDIMLPRELGRWLLPGSNADHCVAKVRVLERTHDEFALLPICYPNTKCVVTESWVSELPDFVETPHVASAGKEELFYLVGLLASVELLRAPVSALGALAQQGKVVVRVPPASLEHLRAMFPRLDIEKLSRYILNVVASSERERPSRGKQAVQSHNVPEDELFRLAGRVMYRIVDDPDSPGSGKSWKQLMRLAGEENEKVRLDPRALSVVADRLIDNGMIVTSIRLVPSSTGDPYIIRTFGPDGEMVMSRIRRQLMTRLPECLLTT